MIFFSEYLSCSKLFGFRILYKIDSSGDRNNVINTINFFCVFYKLCIVIKNVLLKQLVSLYTDHEQIPIFAKFFSEFLVSLVFRMICWDGICKFVIELEFFCLISHESRNADQKN